ncbi:hypothetical protein GCM10009623_22130 [Nocardioides aestuarii]|uniref:Pr6Pr family membrane protein n=1 Tax=Nocardioides aestuarii TaxID=252231 RepID=A0ABW4TLH7_9ACTN
MTHPLSSRARAALLLNAVVAWAGVVLTVLLSTLGWYQQLPVEPGLYGDTPPGAAGALPRLLDTLSYFTIWSNIAVAVGVTLLLARPLRDGVAVRVLRLSGLLMITVTAIVYQVLLAPTAEVVGWSLLTDPILHVVTPVLTVLVWAIWGPRGWIDARLVPAALTVPLLWIVWMLARGAVIDAYPYGFVNVAEVGYASVARTLALILVFGVVVAAAFWGLDVLLRRRSRGSGAPGHHAGRAAG